MGCCNAPKQDGPRTVVWVCTPTQVAKRSTLEKLFYHFTHRPQFLARVPRATIARSLSFCGLPGSEHRPRPRYVARPKFLRFLAVTVLRVSGYTPQWVPVLYFTK